MDIQNAIKTIDGLFRNYNRDIRSFTVDYDEDLDCLYCYYTPYINDRGYVVADKLLYVTETSKKDLQILKDYLDNNRICSRFGCEWCVEWGWKD